MDGDGDLDLVTGAPIDGPGGTREQNKRWMNPSWARRAWPRCP